MSGFLALQYPAAENSGVERRYIVVVEKDVDVEIGQFTRGVLLTRAVDREQLVQVSKGVKWQNNPELPIVVEPVDVEVSREVEV